MSKHYLLTTNISNNQKCICLEIKIKLEMLLSMFIFQCILFIITYYSYYHILFIILINCDTKNIIDIGEVCLGAVYGRGTWLEFLPATKHEKL